MSNRLMSAISYQQKSPTIYLTSLAAFGSASVTFLALSYFKPTNLGQNDLHHDWKSLSLVSGIGGMLTLHYGVTHEFAPISLLKNINSCVVTTIWKGVKSYYK